MSYLIKVNILDWLSYNFKYQDHVYLNNLFRNIYIYPNKKGNKKEGSLNKQKNLEDKN